MENVVVSLHHANHKGADGKHREILVSRALAWATYFSDADRCTHVVATGGSIIPVTETPEQVAALCGFKNTTLTKENENG